MANQHAAIVIAPLPRFIRTDLLQREQQVVPQLFTLLPDSR
jgi:hypothetical protein